MLEPSKRSEETQSDRPIQIVDDHDRNSDLQTIKNQFHEQRKTILQIIYEERYSFPYTFDRIELAERMGKPWPEIQPDVAYLEEEDYLITERCETKKHTFHLLRITPKGVKFVEQPPQIPFRKIDVFISSPGDVYEERQIVKRVIERCNRMHSIKEHYVLLPLAYEESVPAEVGKRPQTIVDHHMMKAGSSDLFICMLWHRMGTPITHEQTGEYFQSGTEYEFVDAYRHNQVHGKPYILLYRGMKPYPAETDSQQLRAINAFFQRFEGEHAEFKGLYKTYHSNEQFEEELFQDINTALSKNLLLLG